MDKGKDPKHTTIDATRAAPWGGPLRILRLLAVVAVVAGAMGSLVLMLRSAQRTPALLLAFFTVWVLSPFVALLWADTVSGKWAIPVQLALYLASFAVTLASLAVYDELIVVRPPASGNAFLFVAVPPISWVIIAIIVAVTVLFSRRDAGQRPGA